MTTPLLARSATPKPTCTLFMVSDTASLQLVLLLYNICVCVCVCL